MSIRLEMLRLVNDLPEEFARVYSRKVSKTHIKFDWLSVASLVLAGLCFYSGRLVIAAAFAFYAICMPVLFIVMFNKSVKKAWESNKISQNADIHIAFYETNYVMKTPISETTVEYENLYKLIFRRSCL